MAFFDWRWCAINERQRRFADEYIISGNVYQSALVAGYSENYAKTHAHKILENVSVKSYIDERMSELESQKIAKADEVLRVLTSVLRQELTEEVVQIDPTNGEFVKTEKKPSIAEVIKAGSELMKRFPLDAERIKLELANRKAELEIQEKEQVLSIESSDDDITAFTFNRSEYDGNP